MKAQDKDLKYSLSPSSSFPERVRGEGTARNYSTAPPPSYFISNNSHNDSNQPRERPSRFTPDFTAYPVLPPLFLLFEKLHLCGLSRSTYPQTVTNRLSPRRKKSFTWVSERVSEIQRWNRLEVGAAAACQRPPVSF